MEGLASLSNDQHHSTHQHPCCVSHESLASRNVIALPNTTNIGTASNNHVHIESSNLSHDVKFHPHSCEPYRLANEWIDYINKLPREHFNSRLRRLTEPKTGILTRLRAGERSDTVLRELLDCISKCFFNNTLDQVLLQWVDDLGSAEGMNTMARSLEDNYDAVKVFIKRDPRNPHNCDIALHIAGIAIHEFSHSFFTVHSCAGLRGEISCMWKSFEQAGYTRHGLVWLQVIKKMETILQDITSLPFDLGLKSSLSLEANFPIEQQEPLLLEHWQLYETIWACRRRP